MSRTLLVIPHFRDTDRLAPFLKELLAVLPPEFSILVSDDGSGAEEVNRLNALIKANQLSAPHTGPNLLDPLLHTPNTGKGGAVMRGWDCGGGFSFLAFADADGAVNAGEIMRASRYLQSEHGRQDALFGSRVKMLGRSIQRTLIRHITGRVFATLVSLVSGLSSYDTQCGLKILTQPAFQKIRPFLRCEGFAFDVEICLLLLKAKQSVGEFPLDWRDVAGSKVSILKDSFRMAVEVFKIRRRLSTIHS
jgi:glycosyltransferase involved in cell wall biosynthesis